MGCDSKGSWITNREKMAVRWAQVERNELRIEIGTAGRVDVSDER
jgi:hypothetical protein